MNIHLKVIKRFGGNVQIKYIKTFLGKFKVQIFMIFVVLNVHILKEKKKISQYLMSNNINYEPQKTFDSLKGVNNGLLSYDFYLSEYNLLIEFQGQQHEKILQRFS